MTALVESRTRVRFEWLDGWVAAALLTALALRLLRLDAAPLWFDEVITARWIMAPRSTTRRSGRTGTNGVASSGIIGTRKIGTK